MIYYGSLHDETNVEHRAYAWQLRAGNLSNLVNIKQTESPKSLIATHLTRSKEGKRNEMMTKLSAYSEGTYIINSGQLALAYVATGSLLAFINNHTNTWDVADGEVLIIEFFAIKSFDCTLPSTLMPWRNVVACGPSVPIKALQ